MARATIPSLKQVATSTSRSGVSSQLDLQDPQTREDIMEALGIEKPRPQLSIFDRITGVLDAFRFTDDIRKAQKEGNILAGIGDFVSDIPKALAGAVTGEDYRDETDKEGGSEILKDIGAEGIVKNVGGFLLDVLGDPTTYVTLGTGSAGKIMTKEGGKVLTKSGAKLFNKLTREGIETLAKRSPDEILELATKEGIELAGKNGLRELAEKLATEKIMKFSKKGVKVLQDLGIEETDKLASQILKEGVIDQGGFKFAGKKLFDVTPEVEKTLNLYFNPIKGVDQNIKRIPVVGEKYSKGMEQIGKTTSNVISSASDTVRKLFDRKYSVTGGNERFNPLYDAMLKTEDYLRGKSQDVVEKFSKEYKDILDAFEKPEILPYILEDTPIDKLDKLPKEIKESLTSAVRQIRTEEEAFNAVESMLKPKSVTEMNLPDNIKPIAEIARKSNSYPEFMNKIQSAVRKGELSLPDQLMLGDRLNMEKFRLATQQDLFGEIDKAIADQGTLLQKRADEILATEGPDSINYQFALQKAKGYGTGVASGIDNARLNYISQNIKDPEEAGRLIRAIEESTTAPNVKESIDAVLKVRPDVAKVYNQMPSTVDNITDPLIEEAKKYKSAEEFVEARISQETGFKDSHTAPSFDGTSVEERMNDGGDFNLSEVIKGQHIQPSDYFDERVGPRYYSYDNQSGMESLTAINNVKRGAKTITAYRSIPKNVEIDELQNGDWISFSKKYVIDHGESRFGEGEYKIIEQEVKPNEVWWDGNDIREWGYDNGEGVARTTQLSREKELTDIWNKAQQGAKVRTKQQKLPVSVMREFADFIDYARGISKAPRSGFKSVYDYEGAVRELAETYGINAEMSNGRLANKLANLLDQNNYGKTLNKDIGRLTARTVKDMTRFRIPKELSETINRKLSPDEVQEILDLNRRIFKDEKLNIVDNLLTPSGQEAVGKYNQGWVDILAKQANAKDTFYHESVHKAIDLFVDKERKDTLFKFAKDKFKLEGLEAEEKIAEEFINYVNGKSIKANKGIRKIFDDIINFIRGISGNKDEIEKLYDDILEGKLVRQGPEISEDFFRQLKRQIATEDPLTAQLQDIGKFKNIIDSKGVKRKIFENTLSDNQIKFLNSKGIFTAEDLVNRSKSKNFYKIRSELTDVISQKTGPRMSRLEAGKEPIIRSIEEEIRSLKADSRFVDLKNQYKLLLSDANASNMSVRELAEELGGDDLVKEVDSYIRMRDQIEQLNFKKQEKITELVNKTVGTEITKTQGYKPLASEFEEIATGLGVKPDRLKTIIKQAQDSISNKLEKAKSNASAEKLLSKVYEIKDPLKREIINRNINNITQNTEVMLDVGAISGSSKARYLGRDYLVTPSGKNLEESKGLMKFFKQGGMKSKLDPRSVTSQKQRIYDYLADVIDAGGKTKLTETSGKEFTANLVEQLARDEMKAVSAKEFKRLADSIINDRIVDAGGNPFYKKVDSIILELKEEGVELSDKLQKAVQTYNKTGKIPEQLKEFFKNRGYQQLTQKGGGVIPVFKDVFFDAESHEFLSKLHSQFFGEENFNEFVRMYDKVHNAIKASQTAWFPAFHVRNMFSNTFTNFIEGVNNPRRYMDAQLIQKYNNLLEKIPLADVKEGAKMQDLLKEIGDKTIKLGDAGSYRISELHQLARYNGVITGGIYGDLSENLLNKGRLGIKSANPLSQEFVLSQVGRKVGSSIEDNARLALFIDKISKGWDIRSSALKVKEVLFDYQDLTDFERNIMRRFVPFYTWIKKNAALQMRRIAKQPGVYTAYLKGFNEIRDAFNDLTPEERDTLPSWVKQGVGVAFDIGGGNVSVIKQFGLPQEAFENLLETNPLNQLGVIPKSILEVGTGQNIFKGKAILDDTDGKAFRNFPQFIKDRMGYREEKRKNKEGEEYTVYYVDAWAKYYLNLILGRTTSEFSKVTNLGAEGDAPADLMNLFTGIKKYDFNLIEEEEKRNRERERELYDILMRRGMAREYTNQYIPAEQKENILSRIGRE